MIGFYKIENTKNKTPASYKGRKMIKTYFLHYAEELTETEYSKLYKSLDQARQKKADRFRNKADRDRCVLAGVLLKYGLDAWETDIEKKQETGTENCENPDKNCNRLHDVKWDENGKPYLEDGPEFSLSHAGQWIGLAIGERPIGLDIEGGRKFQDKAVKKFHPQEQEWYEQLPEEEQEAGFYRLWTGKESYGKRDGRGLAMDLAGFSIFEKDIEKQLCFKKWGKNYYFTLCTEEVWDGKIQQPEMKNFNKTEK